MGSECVVAGEASTCWPWRGRGDQAKSGERNMVLCIWAHGLLGVRDGEMRTPSSILGTRGSLIAKAAGGVETGAVDGAWMLCNASRAGALTGQKVWSLFRMAGSGPWLEASKNMQRGNRWLALVTPSTVETSRRGRRGDDIREMQIAKRRTGYPEPRRPYEGRRRKRSETGRGPAPLPITSERGRRATQP